MADYLFLGVGLLLLIKGAGYLVAGSSSVARGLHVSDFIIGLTVVSFGTSLPELVIALFAGANDSPDLIIGNVVGSNIANILLVLGVAAMIHPLSAKSSIVWREIPFTLLASVVLFAMLNDRFFDHASVSILGRTDALVLLAFFAAFLYYVAQVIKGEKDREWVGHPEGHSVRRSIAEIVGGMVGLTIGGRIAVIGAVNIAESWGMSEAFIGLSVIAIGTSLPELATSSVAAYRRNVDIAVGNVVGSNIFNIFIVLGISGVVKPIPFNPVNNIDMMVMFSATVLLFVFMFIGHPSRTIQRREGGVLVFLYAAYMAFLIYRG